MTYTCRGISLGYIKVNSNTILCKIITENYGLKTFLIKGFQSKKSKTKINILEPMGLIQIKSEDAKNKSFQKLDEARLLVSPAVSISVKLMKLFYAEFIKKIIKDSIKDIKLFEFLWKNTQELNIKRKPKKFEHLIFILELTLFLGFYPNISNSQNNYFNLENGDFESFQSKNTVSKKESDIIKSIILKKCEVFKKKDRDIGFEVLIKYYNYHNHEINNLKSKKIIDSLYE